MKPFEQQLFMDAIIYGGMIKIAHDENGVYYEVLESCMRPSRKVYASDEWKNEVMKQILQQMKDAKK